MDKYDASQLTEFPRFEEEATQSGVSTFFNKLWKFPLFSPNEADNLQNKGDDKPDVLPEEPPKQEEEEKPEPASYAMEFEGRSLQNVLKRISSLVALGSGSGTRYADTELARYWMPDDVSRECYECASRFSALRRRHHCRVCGQIFCSRCCSQRVPGQIFGCAGGLRVCTYCCKVVLSYLRERDPSAAEIATDLRSLQETLQSKFPDNKSTEVASSNFVFSREQDSRERPSAKEALKDVFKHLALALPTQQHRYRLVRYNGVWRGCDVLQWVMDNTNEKTRTQANELCQRLLSAGYLECAGDAPPAFADYALYRPREIDPPSSDNDEPAETAQRLVESVSSYCLDLNPGEISARLIKAPPQLEQKSPSSSDEESPVTDQVEEAKPGCSALSRLGEEHLRLVFRQCLSRAALPAAWADALYPLCRQAADAVMPDMYGNDIDARNYVHVKKVCSGRARDSCLVPGVVLTKNVVHRGMPQQISNPTVLLLDCSIVYQRVEGKHTSLEPVLMQEQEYLSRCAMRIAALRPRVVLVRGAAARAVQDTLRAQGVALAVGVGMRALRRAARCCGGEVVTSIDARIGTPRLGTCANFYVKTLPTKTLMVLEGCAEPQLGCSIILRGESLPELVRVKKVVKFMVLACYNWKLEKSFLADIDAILPEPGTTFDDDNDVFGDKNNDKAETDSQGTNEADVAKGIDNDDSVSEETLKPNHDVNNESNQFDEDNNDSSNDTDLFRNDDCKSNQISKIIAETESSEIVNTCENNDGTKDECKKNNVVDKDSKLNENDKVKEIVGVANDDKIEEKTEAGIDDPLLSSKYTSDKNLSCGVPIRDFSDPLRAIGDDEVFLHEVEEKFKSEDDMGDRWSSDTILSMSANVCVPPPCGEVAWPSPSPRRAPERAARGSKARMDRQREENAFVGVTPPHPFVLTPITAGLDDPALRASLAHYRATGGRILNNHHRPGCSHYKPTVLKPPKEPEPETEKQDDGEPLDPLAPENHQRLSLLLYSFSSKSANVPDFCVNPWIVTMEMYGKHDISLGAFLRKYCFDPHQKCSSNNCQVPVNQHVRRFVHGDVCITITCNTVGHSNVDKYKDEDNKQVSFRSRCPRCGTPSRPQPVRRPSLALSLAQYVRLRALARRSGPRGRGCPHPLHAHTHMFVLGLTTASFKYNKISTFDVKLPPPEIATNYDTRQMRDALITQLNDLMLKGHETFAPPADGESCASGAAFKQHTDQIHLALTAKHLYEAPSLAGVVRRLWAVADALTLAEKMVADAADRDAGAQALSGKQSKPEPAVEEKSDIEDSSGDPANDSSEEDEEKGDKKTVRQILIQLLSNNQPSNQRGLAVVGGLIPVWARGGDIGAVVAAALASVTYHRTLRANAMAARHSVQTEQEEVESSNSGKEKSESDKSKPAKPNDHIEVLLKDGLLCRIYFASQFLKLRHMLLAPLDPDRDDRRCCDDFKEKDAKSLCSTEECFLRSLSHCVPWAARGGKSGSTFCKTKDDRFVLKEMTKPEWQQFLEFAPHYFSYVTNCHQNKLPSLLARIVGVYSVGGAGNGVLVMENVWYGAAHSATRYDLKGAQRHRLASRDQDAAAVLLDENLLNLRWETPLYIPSHRGAVLWRGLARDAAFLARHTVMDYSLLLGIDGGTLVLGIIDYIRTFTWDKKLEHLVKKNLGSGQPTVVSPEQYKRRFHAACRKYFLQCPSYWDHLCQEELQE